MNATQRDLTEKVKTWFAEAQKAIGNGESIHDFTARFNFRADARAAYRIMAKTMAVSAARIPANHGWL